MNTNDTPNLNTGHNDAVDKRFISYTAAAALMGLGFATALGVSMQSMSSVVKRGGPEQREMLVQALEAGDYEALETVLEAASVRHSMPQTGELEYVDDGTTDDFSDDSQETHEVHAARLEAVLRTGSMQLWEQYMDKNYHITAAITEDKIDQFLLSRSSLG